MMLAVSSRTFPVCWLSRVKQKLTIQHPATTVTTIEIVRDSRTSSCCRWVVSDAAGRTRTFTEGRVDRTRPGLLVRMGRRRRSSILNVRLQVGMPGRSNTKDSGARGQRQSQRYHSSCFGIPGMYLRVPTRDVSFRRQLHIDHPCHQGDENGSGASVDDANGRW